MSRVYVGHLPARCNERDVERFFRGYGKLRDVVLKNGYGFVEFENRKDAEDAVYELHGQELRGERIIVEHARLPPGSRGGSRRGPGRDRRYGPPTRTEYRVIVENLSSRVSWQDLKDLMRKAGDVTYADAHKAGRNDGDMKDAIEKFDGHELYGRRLRVYEDRQNRRSRSGSLRRSRSDSRSRKRSRSRGSFNRQSSRSPRVRRDRSGSSNRQRSDSRDRRDSHKRSRRGSDAVNSRSASRRSESRHSRDRSPSHHSDKRSEGPESRSPSRNGRDISMKDTSDRRSGSRTPGSRSRSRSRSAASRSPVRSHSASRSRSGSRRSRSGSAERRSDEELDNSHRSEDQDGHDQKSED